MAISVPVETERIRHFNAAAELHHNLQYRVRTGKPAYARVVVPGAQVDRAGFRVEILPAVAQGVRVVCTGALLVAECVVLVFLRHRACRIGQLHHVAVRIVQVVALRVAALYIDRVDSALSCSPVP